MLNWMTFFFFCDFTRGSSSTARALVVVEEMKIEAIKWSRGDSLYVNEDVDEYPHI